MVDYDLDLMQFNYQAAMNYLNGEDTLEQAFNWNQSPQGYDFWRNETSERTYTGDSTVRFMCDAYQQIEMHKSGFSWQ